MPRQAAWFRTHAYLKKYGGRVDIVAAGIMLSYRLFYPKSDAKLGFFVCIVRVFVYLIKWRRLRDISPLSGTEAGYSIAIHPSPYRLTVFTDAVMCSPSASGGGLGYD